MKDKTAFQMSEAASITATAAIWPAVKVALRETGNGSPWSQKN